MRQSRLVKTCRVFPVCCARNLKSLFDSGENSAGEEIDNLSSNRWECLLTPLVLFAFGMA